MTVIKPHKVRVSHNVTKNILRLEVVKKTEANKTQIEHFALLKVTDWLWLSSFLSDNADHDIKTLFTYIDKLPGYGALIVYTPNQSKSLLSLEFEAKCDQLAPEELEHDEIVSFQLRSLANYEFTLPAKTK